MSIYLAIYVSNPGSSFLARLLASPYVRYSNEDYVAKICLCQHIITTPDGQEKFQIVQQQGINKIVIAPTSTTATGARPIMGGNTDIWIVRGNYVIRVHKRLRRAKFTPENTQCPVPTEQLDEWRQTTVN